MAGWLARFHNSGRFQKHLAGRISGWPETEKVAFSGRLEKLQKIVHICATFQAFL